MASGDATTNRSVRIASGIGIIALVVMGIVYFVFAPASQDGTVEENSQQPEQEQRTELPAPQQQMPPAPNSGIALTLMPNSTLANIREFFDDDGELIRTTGSGNNVVEVYHWALPNGLTLEASFRGGTLQSYTTK